MPRDSKRLEDAARAGWLYYIAGNTQDEIARKLGVSRQSAQRLVAQAMADGIVKVRIDHPIGNCLSLAARLADRYGLDRAEVVPTDPGAASPTLGLAEVAADVIESWLAREAPLLMGIGTGRTLRAAIASLPRIACPHHRIVSLTGNIAPDGSIAFYNVIFSIAERVTASTYPMPLPVLVSSADERDALQSQPLVRTSLDLAAEADVAMVGIGEIAPGAPLVVDGFVGPTDLAEMETAHAAGEILGWVFDGQGRLIEGLTNDRVASAPLPDPGRTELIGAAMGPRKVRAIRAALTGGLLSGLLTDEATAIALLDTG